MKFKLVWNAILRWQVNLPTLHIHSQTVQVVLLDCLVLRTKPPVAVFQSTRDEVMHCIMTKPVRSCRPSFYCLRF